MSKRDRYEKAAARSRARKKAWAAGSIALVAAFGIAVAVCAGRSDEEPALVSAAARAAAVDQNGRALPVVDVYKSPTCGCCSKWVDYLRDHGFTVRTTDTDDLVGVKGSHHVPRPLQSCHTALVDGYVVEGHVPLADVRRLLNERPKIAGIAVPGMPIGSPGMEVASGKTEPYDVVAFDKSGSTRVFATHR